MEHRGFKDVVRKNWDDNYSTNPFLDFKIKIKKVKAALASWSRETYGETFKQLIISEDIARIKEKAEYARYLQLQEKSWQQKAGMTGLKVGIGTKDSFIAWCKGEDKNEGKKNTECTWDRDQTNVTLLVHILELISEDDNTELGIVGDEEEVKNVVFKLNGDSSSGLHGLTATTNIQINLFTRMIRGQFLMKYLGCPIIHTRKRKEHYTNLFDKIKGRLENWNGRMLSYRGKIVLLSTVRQSIPIYVLSLIMPPNCVIKGIHRIFAKFY
ncbi:hypothetical protein H5410_046179 [Solanum commersonii]|uniref:Uncharacterized protein n=1 Tax=Solanum commersonii TaxID=4109 RepID=A0A9J5XBK3_SOLCO|nr:hypothetical protein H5410_046179 [Solanum commersonii]